MSQRKFYQQTQTGRLSEPGSSNRFTVGRWEPIEEHSTAWPWPGPINSEQRLRVARVDTQPSN